MKIAYIMSRFPKLTETFILYEMTEMRERGFELEVYPLLKHRTAVRHPEAEAFVEKAFYHPFFSLSMIRAHLKTLVSRPVRYFTAFLDALRGTWGNLNYMVGVIVYFPKAVWFAQKMKEQGVDHIHAHFCNHPAMVAFVISRITDIPFSFTAHGADLHMDQRMIKEKVGACCFAVAISDYNKEMMLAASSQAWRSKIHVVHCGVDPDQFKPAERKPLNQRLRLICVGTFEEVKGHKYLVEACGILRDKGIPFECRLIGEGPLTESIRKQVQQAGLTESVSFLGGQPRPKVLELMSCSDVVILPSVLTPQGKREGIPVALMEGMAVGLPAISSRLSGIPELIQDGVSGILTEPRNSKDLAQAIERLACDQALRFQMGAAARRRIEEEFDLKANVRQLIRLLESNRHP